MKEKFMKKIFLVLVVFFIFSCTVEMSEKKKENIFGHMTMYCEKGSNVYGHHVTVNGEIFDTVDIFTGYVKCYNAGKVEKIYVQTPVTIINFISE